MKKVTLGCYVAVTFMDHTSHSGENPGILSCEIMGRITAIESKHYVIMSWICNREVDNPNNEGYSILKSTITNLQVLKR